MTTTNTPFRPDATLVARAIESLSDWTDGRVGRRWNVAETLEFGNSTILYIDVVGSESPKKLVYKFIKPAKLDGWFKRNLSVINPAVRLLEAEGLLGAPVLSFDVRQCTVITLYLPGETLRQLQRSERRLTEQQERLYRKIGRACRIMESVDQPYSDDELTEHLWRRFEGRLLRAGFSNSLKRDIEESAQSRLAAATSHQAAYVRSHFEMAHPNIVLDGGAPGFIDLNFRPSLIGATVAKMIHREELGVRNHWLSPAVGEATDALLQGYGPIESPDAMAFQQMGFLLGVLSAPSQRSWVSPRRKRALIKLKSLVTAS